MIWLVMLGVLSSLKAGSLHASGPFLLVPSANAAVDVRVPFQLRNVAAQNSSSEEDVGGALSLPEAIEVEALAPEGHSFNTKAPMVLEVAQISRTVMPKESSGKKVLFRLPGLQRRSFKVSLYVCDDATSACTKRTAWAAWTGSQQEKLIIRY